MKFVGETLKVTGDKVRIVATTIWKSPRTERVLVLINDTEDLAMGVHWFQRVTKFPDFEYKFFWSIY